MRQLAARFVSIGDLRAETRLLGSRPAPVPTPELAAMPIDPVAVAHGGGAYTPPPSAVATLRSVLYDPARHLVLTRGRRIVEESSIQGRALGDLSLREVLRRSQGRVTGTAAVFRSRWNNHYHTLIDNLPRLYLLHGATAAGDEMQLLAGHPLTPVESYFLPRLAPPGARVVHLPEDRACRVDRLLLPGFLSRRFAGWLPPDYRAWMLERVAPPRPSRRDQRIFISRAQVSSTDGRSIENEEEVLRALEPFGFRRHVLDGMPIAEQVSLFYDAEAVVGAHGAGLANLVFGGSAKVVELFSASFVTPHYYFLSKSCGHDYRHLCGGAADRNANLRVDVRALTKLLRELEL